MAKLITFLCFYFVLLQSVLTLKDLPPYFPHCYIDDPYINDCLLKATETVKPYLLKGIPELNIPPIKEFHIPELTIEHGTDAINYRSEIKNLTIIGLGNYKHTKFEFDVPNLVFTGEVQMKEMVLTGNYSVTGKILALPLQGQGVFTAKIANSNGSVYSECFLKNENGEEYLKIKSINIKIDVGGVSSEWSGLFEDNEVLANAVNGLLRNNMDDLIAETKPTMEKIIGELFKRIFENSLSRVPFKNLYPKRKKAD